MLRFSIERVAPKLASQALQNDVSRDGLMVGSWSCSESIVARVFTCFLKRRFGGRHSRFHGRRSTL